MLLVLGLFACAQTQTVTVPFIATVNGDAFACGQTYPDVGSPGDTIDPIDLRLFVHDVGLVDDSGATVPIDLDQDGTWQYQNVALLDFEDGTGACETGSPDMHTELTGTVPKGTYAGLSFTLGVPDDLNHIDASTADAPLNDTGLWWGWLGGYKYAAIDVSTPVNPEFYLHLGATDCTDAGGGSYACTLDNLSAITLPDFTPDSDAINLDLSRLYAASDLDAIPDGVTDSVSGCMTLAGDPECGPLLAALGLPWDDQAAVEQTFFEVQSQ